jgi:hypothetical protein
MPSEPKTPEPSNYQSRSDYEERSASEPLVRKRFWTGSPLWDGPTSQRDENGPYTQRHLKQEAKSFPHQEGHPMRVFIHKTILGQRKSHEGF